MVSEDPSILAEGLSKRYPGSKTFALRDLNLRIMPGEVYGFLGPNGAGKSTTIRTLMNFIQPTSGRAQILGSNIVKQAVEIKKKIGYLPGELNLYYRMSGRNFLAYMSELQPPRRVGYRRELANIFDANLDMRIGKLSKGNRQKIGLIQAFMHEPDVLILDEPTSGLDPLMQENFFELVRQTKARGATLFISSHNLSEVQKMCDRVGFIREGRLISEQVISEFVESAVQTFDIAFAGHAPLAEIKRLAGIKAVSNSPRHVTVHIRGDLAPFFRLLAKHKVHTLDRRETSLEEEFLKFYKSGGAQ